MQSKKDQPSNLVTVAAGQLDVELGNKDGNLLKIQNTMEAAAKRDARFIVFPECSVTGYMFDNKAEAVEASEPVPGPATETIATQCKKLNMYAIVGIVERFHNKIYNTAAFLGPSGFVGKYRKAHIPFVGVDRFVQKGDIEPHVVKTDIGKIGYMICYDMCFPELSRVLALKGAEIIVDCAAWVINPTDWPSFDLRTFSTCRAAENKVFFIVANHTGTERKTYYMGMSRILDVAGRTLAQASSFGGREDAIYATIDPSQARNKSWPYRFDPRVASVDYMKDRRPEFYGLITRR